MHAKNDQLHATTDQLLEIIDGEQSPLSSHLCECKQCQIALAKLQSFESEIGLRMFDGANKVPSIDVWNKIQSSLEQESALEQPKDIT
jgi:hypothetical protein